MGKDKRYPEKRDISAIVILLATQGMIHLGEIADPLHGQKALNIEGARFFIDLLAELKRKTRGNLRNEESRFYQRHPGKSAKNNWQKNKHRQWLKNQF